VGPVVRAPIALSYSLRSRQDRLRHLDGVPLGEDRGGSDGGVKGDVHAAYHLAVHEVGLPPQMVRGCPSGSSPVMTNRWDWSS
jgi:hypothetical protein